MDNSGPILVKPAVPDEDIPEGVEVDVTTPTAQKSLLVPIPDDVLSEISQNTTEVQEKLNKFVNGLNSKIQTV